MLEINPVKHKGINFLFINKSKLKEIKAIIIYKQIFRKSTWWNQ